MPAREEISKDPNKRYISHSQIGTWLGCEQHWDYKYRQGWRPKTTSTALKMGDYIHGKLDIAYQLLAQGATWEEVLDILLNDLTEETLNCANAEWGGILSRTIKTITRYAREYGPSIDAGITEFHSEFYFNYDFVTPEGREVTLEGYVDLLYYHPTRGWIVRDHKSYEGRGWSKEQVYYDMQQTLYIAGLRGIGIDVTRGEINLLNTHDYKDWGKVPLDKLFKIIPAHRTDEMLSASITWAGELVDHQENLAKPQMSRNRQCVYCPFNAPCMIKFEGRDDQRTLKIGFDRKDGYSEYHAAETN